MSCSHCQMKYKHKHQHHQNNTNYNNDSVFSDRTFSLSCTLLSCLSFTQLINLVFNLNLQFRLAIGQLGYNVVVVVIVLELKKLSTQNIDFSAMRATIQSTIIVK